MNSPLESLLARYKIVTTEDPLRALRETAQRIALLGLWRGKMFEHAAFYGGTALRLVHGLPRFSEDLDFSLLTPTPEFSLSRYLTHLQRELAAFGFEVTVAQRQRNEESGVEGAFLKMNTRLGFIALGIPDTVVARTHRDSVLKIKFEVDTDPPPGAATRTDYLYAPQPFTIRTYDLPSMFAGKLHAAIARAWGTRVKGRDWFDLIWFVGREIPVNTKHLQARLVQTGHLPSDQQFGAEQARDLLRSRIRSLDFESARSDVSPFVDDKRSLELWGQELFTDVATKILFA
jgi:hypothetical protein